MFYKYSVCCCFHSITKPCLTPCDPWTAVHLTSLSLNTTQSLPKFMSVESVMQSNHLLLCLPLFLLYIFVIFMYYTFFSELKLLKVYKSKFIYHIFIIKFNLYCSEKMFDTLYHNLLLGILGSIIGESHSSMPKIGVCAGY